MKALGALLRQELRRLWPWIAVLALYDVGQQLLKFYKSVPDVTPWVSTLPLLEPSGGGTTLVLALLFCQAGFPRDADDGTDAFLFSLPVARRQILGARVLVPGLILSGQALLEELLRYLAHLPATGSFVGSTFRADWLAQTLLLSVALAWICVGYAQLLTVFRRFGYLLLFAFHLTLSVAEGEAVWVRKLDPASVLRVQLVGQRALIAWDALLGHALAAALAGGVAALFWVGPMDRVSAAFARWARRPVLAWGAALLIAGLAVAHFSERGGPIATGSRPSYGTARPAIDSTPVQLRTRYHELSYPTGLASRVEPLAEVVDELHERIAERLGVPAGGELIVVDLTRGSPTHAGSATWNTIRMDAFTSPDPELLARVFAHELTHVLSLRASDGRLSSEGEAVGFFAEGLAEALAQELRPSQATAEASRLEAVLAHRRLRLTFAQLIRYESFTQRYGPQLVYPVGFTWAEALLQRCGADAPQKLLRALGSPDVPLRLAPEALWQHLLQRAGCDIATVNSAWEGWLAAGEAALASELARVPELHGGNARWSGDELQLLARADGEPVAGTVFFANVRARSTGPEAFGTMLFAQRRADGTLEFRVPAEMVLDGTLQFQLGLRFERQGAPVRFALEWSKTRVAQ